MVQDLIRRAQRRLFLNEALAQFAFAAAVSAGGLALLLVLGTRYFQWWTVIIPAVAGVGIGIWRVRNRIPGNYETAVRLDQNAGLHDSLSTAFHFSSEDKAQTGSVEFRDSQLDQAQTAARSVSLETAVPFTFPRAVYVMAVLCLVASVLVALRFRTGQGLDLQRPLTEVLFEDQAAKATKKQLAMRNTPGSWTQQAEQMLSKLGLRPADDGPLPGDPDALDKAIAQALQKPNGSDGKAAKGADGNKAAPGKDGTPSEDSKSGDPIDGADKTKGDAKDGEGSSASQSEQNEKGSSGKADAKQESLISKLKEAVSSLMSKSKQQPGGADQKAPDQKSAKNESQKSGKKGDAAAGKPEQSDNNSDESDPNGDALGGQKGQGKESTASNQKQSQEGSGIGAADGLKDIKAAEQLKAMGKISEIIGKRSASVSGETSVEVQSGNQQLHTAYGNTNAAHGQTEGDVTRDEIPVGLQSYVQQYFAEVRKAAATKKSNPRTTRQ